MGAVFPPPKHLEHANVLFPESRHFPYHGNPATYDASRAEADSRTYHAGFYIKVCCVPHRDGQQMIVYWVPDRWKNPRETPAWAVKRLKKLYERLSSAHPRIVCYNGSLDGAIGGKYKEKIGGLLLEKLTPGSICLMDLPSLTAPKAATSNSKDALVLALYYRWALQALSAMSFFHDHSIFLRVFTTQMVWLHSDFSLAITGFINTVTTDDYPYLNSTTDHRRNQMSSEYFDELPCENDGMATDEPFRYGEYGEEIPGVEEDLFEWATFVWRLMTSGEETNSGWSNDPNSLMSDGPVADYGQNVDTLRAVLRQRAADGVEWQQLEEVQLGKVFVKAWRGDYEGVARDVAAMAETIGISVTEDGVDVGVAWENALEVVETKIGYCSR